MMELNIVVTIVIIKQIENKALVNMCSISMIEYCEYEGVLWI